MDKNTLTGLVLMAAVMFGFFWLTKPSEAELAAQRERQEQAAADALRAAQQQPEVAPFTPADSADLASAVRSMGTRNADGSVSFSNELLNLTVDSIHGLSGTYKDAAGSADIRQVLANNAGLTTARTGQSSCQRQDENCPY